VDILYILKYIEKIAVQRFATNYTLGINLISSSLSLHSQNISLHHLNDLVRRGAFGTQNLPSQWFSNIS